MSTDLVQSRANNLKKLLEASQKEIAAALPKHLTPERMARIALTEARKIPALLECDQASFVGAIIQASQLGLEPGGALGHCYLIPFNNKKANRKEVQFIVGYRGFLDLVRRSGQYEHVIARAVYEGDEFSYQFGLKEELVHKPLPVKHSSKLIYVYAIAFPKDGGKAIFDVMTKEEVDEIKSRSASANFGPWQTDYPAMAKKTVIRRLFKYLPASIEIQQAIGLDELVDADESQGNGSVIETQGRTVSEKASLLEEVSKKKMEDHEPSLDVSALAAEPGSFDDFETPQIIKGTA